MARTPDLNWSKGYSHHRTSWQCINWGNLACCGMMGICQWVVSMVFCITCLSLVLLLFFLFVCFTSVIKLFLIHRFYIFLILFPSPPGRRGSAVRSHVVPSSCLGLNHAMPSKSSLKIIAVHRTGS